MAVFSSTKRGGAADWRPKLRQSTGHEKFAYPVVSIYVRVQQKNQNEQYLTTTNQPTHSINDFIFQFFPSSEVSWLSMKQGTTDWYHGKLLYCKCVARGIQPSSPHRSLDFI